MNNVHDNLLLNFLSLNISVTSYELLPLSLVNYNYSIPTLIISLYSDEGRVTEVENEDAFHHSGHHRHVTRTS